MAARQGLVGVPPAAVAALVAKTYQRSQGQTELALSLLAALAVSTVHPPVDMQTEPARRR